MEARHIERVEGAIDSVAAAVFAAAAGYAVFRVGLPLASAAAVVIASFFFSLRVLGSVRAGSPHFILEPFEVGPLPVAVEVDELQLSDADRLHPSPQPPAGDDELVLDDVLASLGEGSRVVRLFDPSAMPTPGELKARIDRHLDEPDESLLSSDASKALHDALSELRRTLR